jgi:hypothetical protein
MSRSQATCRRLSFPPPHRGRCSGFGGAPVPGRRFHLSRSFHERSAAHDRQNNKKRIYRTGFTKFICDHPLPQKRDAQS